MTQFGGKKIAWLLPVIATALYTFSTCLADQEVIEQCNSTTGIAKIVNRLSHRLTTAIGGTENLFFSPLSISVALAMVYLGARGYTEAQMNSKLGYYELLGNASLVHNDFHDMLNLLTSGTGEYRLLVANGLFAQAGYEILQSYTSGLKKHYNAKVNTLNFTSDAQGTMEHINKWVSNHTEGKIAELVNEPFDRRTVLVLLNGIYFQGFWKYPFSDQLTNEREFYAKDGLIKIIPFMEIIKKLNYFQDEDYTFLELDYRGGHISMVFALPNEKEKFPSLELTSELLCHVRANFNKDAVDVKIPKFTMEYERELTSDMKAIGLKNIFSFQSNLSGMRNSNDLFVSSIIHKAVIELNEQGTKAAAVTGVSISSRMKKPQFKEFIADHPFVFSILDKFSGTILFMGRVSNP